MVWNASRPADSDRIRLSAGLIRDNWMALETGTVPFDTISLQSQASFPSLAGHNRLYGFNSAVSGNIELRSVNSGSQSVQLTENGLVGAATQNARFNNLQVNGLRFNSSPSLIYTGATMTHARGTVDANGSISQAVNMNSVRNSTGVYTITIPAGILIVDSYQILMQILGGGTHHGCTVVSKSSISPLSPTVIVVNTYETDSSTSLSNAGFDIIIVGGR